MSDLIKITFNDRKGVSYSQEEEDAFEEYEEHLDELEDQQDPEYLEVLYLEQNA